MTAIGLIEGKQDNFDKKRDPLKLQQFWNKILTKLYLAENQL